ncbi:MAG TPA: hypothetical protein VGJ15_04145 [Pirellulales bacterium]|jgi:hypothetical protein
MSSDEKQNRPGDELHPKSDSLDRLPDELKSLELALVQLQPAESRIDRDRLMYLSGRASVAGPASLRGPTSRLSLPNGRFLWSLATAALVLLSLGLGGRLLYLEGRGDRLVYVQQPGHSAEATFASQSLPEPRPRFSDVSYKPVLRTGANYLQLRDAVLAVGISALPETEKSTSDEEQPSPTDKQNGRERRNELPAWPGLPPELLGG